ncbi:polyketide synthase [Sphaerisporangium krabiense]|uniref:Enediyne polyketide synthase n=1 Tax=Sphaerisporangium krabiense TaxID=763782 RepID=A0A7W8ZA06_9ACTN|nr:type I polyketide synthase [Sphaerisporangium krabiense]MBB5630169.1 enediyne polyketide synthase [Sphaerisporangium krabiense]GII65120.1 polyketide synthase [Sphaerisporangium krabiense]
MTRIAIVGMACRYPDATSPRELWENALAGRRAFRRLPDVRMRLEDYWDPDPATPDTFYARTAAVIEGYEFDRVRYKIAGSTYRSTDLTHWLALDMAGQALADAGFPGAEGLPRERTGVVVGNTLTGEFTRANVMRLRWPYVRRTVAAGLKEQGWDDDRLATFLADLEVTYKNPFPPVDEDTLAGGLSNTIAGRICNHFDLNGGGYTVDGACSSSLLSVTTACKGLIDGDVDVAIAGGVDLSIDPFEIIGFAKTGALAKGEFRLYDRHSNGFWPGEGCGMVVLMREEDALAARHRIYATIAGWGISSDGKGGITRPEVGGYKLALRRAYERAGFGIESVELFEGHGTGTAVGDKTELTALSEARAEAGADVPAAVTSIKGMIGHAKAAAGVAGLIKTAMAVHEQVLPPTIGCVDPQDILTSESATLRALRKAEPWPAGVPVRAGVTAMGFGGINTHVVLEKTGPRKRVLSTRTRQLAASSQDAELLLADAASPQALRDRLAELADFVITVSYGQVADLAATLQRDLRDLPFRAAVVATSPEDAERQLRRAIDALDAGETTLITPDGRAFLGHADGPGRVGFLFPGQGSGRGTSGGALRRRFAEVEEIYLRADLPTSGDMVATAVAQPRIVTGSIAGLRALSLIGVDAEVAVGHSLGEISALHWAGALDEDALLRVAAVRGRAMTERSSATGTMAGVRATPDAVIQLLGDLPVVIAGYNGPEQTVVAGTVEAVEAFGAKATAAGLKWTRLAVSHAFHSPLVAPAAEQFGAALDEEEFGPVGRRIVSTVTGETLASSTDVRVLLRDQITDPVLFTQAVERAAKDIDLFVEVGPGRVLSGLAASVTDVPAVPLDTDDESLTGLLRVAGAAYVSGVPVVHEELFHGRLLRPLEVGTEFSFFESPVEQAPQVSVTGTVRREAAAAPAVAEPAAPAAGAGGAESSIDLLRRLAAERAELPLEMVSEDARPLDELHLSSVTVMHIIDQASQRLGVPASNAPTNLATASLRELSEALDALAADARNAEAAGPAIVAGAAPWSRPFAVDLDELPLPARTSPQENGRWRLFAPEGTPLAESLHQALETGGVGSGLVVVLPEGRAEAHLEHALRAAKEAVASEPGTRFVAVQHGAGAAGLAKTLQLEAPHLRTTIVHLPPGPDVVARVVDEVAATTRFSEVFYDDRGARRVPTLRVLPVRAARTDRPLGAGDVLLVTGGGKGITAECALAVAADSGAKLAVLGRSDPAADQELSDNLRRMADSGVTVRYARADVTDAAQVRAAVAGLAAELGQVTAVLHGAGRNEPAALTGLDMGAFRRTFAPKVDGLRNVLDAVDPGALRLLVTFGSIIGRAGLQGEAHYSTANDWMAEITREVGETHPGCRAICMEWSVWSEVGMGEKLSVVDALGRMGVTAITPEQGVQIMRRLVTDPDVPATVVISGRTQGIDTARYDLPELPLLRFVDKPLVHYHGVELVTEVEMNAGTDLYLADHLLDGNLLFPAVFGMEAMAQVAGAVTGRGTAPVIEEAEFVRPIIVPPAGSTTIRVAATVVDGDQDGETVAVAIRSAETGFEVDHFRATVRFTGDPVPQGPPDQVAEGLPVVPLDPATEMYGDVLFQGGRFHRLRRYHRAAARHVDAEVAALDARDWFAGFLPGELRLADPGMRDALMHGNQVCVPDATLLPTGIERVHAGGAALTGTEGLRYCATERLRDGDTYIYDIAVRTPAGEVVERWEGLRLQAVRKKDGRGPWVTPLLGSYVERTLEDLVGARVAVAVEPHHDEAGDETRTAVAAGRAAGRPVTLRARPDGRQEVEGGPVVSAAHGAGLTLVVLADGGAGTGVAEVAERTEAEWKKLLGARLPLAKEVSARTGEGLGTAAARVQAAVASMREAGLSARARLTFHEGGGEAWAVFASGQTRVATLATTLRDAPAPVVLAVLTEGRP